MQLPVVQGRNLQRRKMEFPRDFAGRVNLVFIAFLRSHQDIIDEWVPFVAELAEDYPEFSYYEFPTLPRKGPIYRTFLNEGMRAGIPNNDTRARTITLYLNKNTFRKALNILNEQEMWLYLFDQKGKVLWRTNGRFAAENSRELRHTLDNFLNSN